MALRFAIGRLAVSGGLAAAAGCAGVAYCETQGPLFDPEALERGAKALREINKSPNAKEVRMKMEDSTCTKTRHSCLFKSDSLF